MSPAGTLKPHRFHILLALAEAPRHGTAIMEEVLERTEGAIRLWPGILYGTLREMTDEGLIEEVAAPPDAPTEGGKRRFYALTRLGRLTLRDEVDRLAALLRVARDRRVGEGLEPA